MTFVGGRRREGAERGAVWVGLEADKETGKRSGVGVEVEERESVSHIHSEHATKSIGED
jgi:hypothetical protein